MTILDSGAPFSSLTRRGASMAGPSLDAETDADVWHPGQQPTDLLSLTKLTYGLGSAAFGVSAYPGPEINRSGCSQPCRTIRDTEVRTAGAAMPSGASSLTRAATGARPPRGRR